MAETSHFYWAQAEVVNHASRDALVLRVPLREARPAAWRRHFEWAANRGEVRGGHWGEAHLRGGAVEVLGVAEGWEQSLRAFLEDVVGQADRALEEERARERQRRDEYDERTRAAERMTDRFRDAPE